jgi:hypothetical protein
MNRTTVFVDGCHVLMDETCLLGTDLVLMR